MDEEGKTIEQQAQTFDITIANGAARKLQSLIDHFQGDEIKVVSLALELLNLVKNSESVQFHNVGEIEMRGVKIPKKLDGTQ